MRLAQHCPSPHPGAQVRACRAPRAGGSGPVRLLALLILLAGAACPDGGSSAPDADVGPEATAARLLSTLEDLAAFGEKRCGTSEGLAAAEYVRDRFTAAGLEDVAFEPFSFLQFEVASSSLAVTADGQPLAMGHAVLAYSGAGSVDATLVDLGSGDAPAYEGVDVTGQVVLVHRTGALHREAQYLLAQEHGAVGFLFLSGAPENLVQVGTVSAPEDGLGPMPALTIGAADGQRIRDALDAGLPVRVAMSVEAAVVPATGQNVVGWLRGSDPGGGYLLVGGHFDTWFTGSTDNGAAVAATLELAERLVRRGAPRRLGVAFVAYDGEELGLFGGYHFLREHVVRRGEPLRAFVNLEMPANGPDDGLRALAYTHGGGVDRLVLTGDAVDYYSFLAGMELVPGLFGGFIPTDIQGLYWGGIQGLTTACDAPYYHTTADTPDKVDVPFLAGAVGLFEGLLGELDALTDAELGSRDREVWEAAVALAPAGADTDVTVSVRNGHGDLQADVTVWLSVYVDGFTRSHRAEERTDPLGEAVFRVPAASLEAGQGDRWLSVRAGDRWPLCETLVPLD